jgi:hypothetical protein
MSFVFYLFMLDEVGTSGVCGEEGLQHVAGPTDPERSRRRATSCARTRDWSLTEHVRALTRGPCQVLPLAHAQPFWHEVARAGLRAAP